MDLKLFDAVFLSVRLITATAITVFLLSIPPPDDGGGDLRLPHQIRMHPMWTFYPFVPVPKGRSKRELVVLIANVIDCLTHAALVLPIRPV